MALNKKGLGHKRPVSDGAKLRMPMLISLLEQPRMTRAVPSEVLIGGDVESFVQPRWYAVYTRANHERSVAKQFGQRGVESFLPQYESVRKWKDRRVHLQMPLFPGYVFVRLALQNRIRVLEVPGVARLVSFAGKPAALSEEEFAGIRGLLSKGLRAEPHPFLTIGRRVRVCNGPLDGMTGIIVRRKNSSRLVISLELIRRGMAVDLGSEDVITID